MTDPNLKTFLLFIVDYWKIYSENRHKSCEIFKEYNNITRDEAEYFIADVIQIRLYDFLWLWVWEISVKRSTRSTVRSSNVCE